MRAGAVAAGCKIPRHASDGISQSGNTALGQPTDTPPSHGNKRGKRPEAWSLPLPPFALALGVSRELPWRRRSTGYKDRTTCRTDEKSGEGVN